MDIADGALGRWTGGALSERLWWYHGEFKLGILRFMSDLEVSRVRVQKTLLFEDGGYPFSGFVVRHQRRLREAVVDGYFLGLL